MLDEKIYARFLMVTIFLVYNIYTVAIYTKTKHVQLAVCILLQNEGNKKHHTHLLVFICFVVACSRISDPLSSERLSAVSALTHTLRH